MEARRPSTTREGCADSAIKLLAHRANLTVALSPASLGGHGEIRVRAQTATREIQLDTLGMRILHAAVDGRKIQFQQEERFTCFEMSPPLAAGEEVDLALKWQVDPAAKRLTFASDQVWAAHNTSAWLPTRLDVDQQASLSLTVTYPDGYALVVANDRGGTHPMRFGSGITRSTHVTMDPSQPALYAFAVGAFRIARYYGQGFMLSAVGPQDADLDHVLELTLPMYQFLAARLGRLPGYANYTQVFVHGDVLLPAVGATFFAESLLGDLKGELAPADDWILGHGLVHQWFGVRVLTATLEDIWLGEGLATFMVAALKEDRWGRTAYDGELEGWRACSRKIHESGADQPLAGPSLPNNDPSAEARLRKNGLIYCRAALVLDKLRRELGDEVFWKSMRAYVATQAGKLSRTKDFQSTLSKVSERDLSPFFARWVYAVAHDF